jgi:hypothetical protein
MLKRHFLKKADLSYPYLHPFRFEGIISVKRGARGGAKRSIYLFYSNVPEKGRL